MPVDREIYAKRKAAGVALVEHQVCKGCGVDKPAVDFRFNWVTKTHLNYLCRFCVADRDRLSRFDMTAEEYRQRLRDQGHTCAICKQPETSRSKSGAVKALAVDHNHATGELRGLLCANCNKGIGNLGDDPDRLDAAAAYLRAHATVEAVI